MFRHTVVAVSVFLMLSCGPRPGTPPVDTEAPKRESPLALDALVTITVVGTNDIHGAVERLPHYAGYVDVLREQRKQGGGGLILLDGGDMFQGTLESNLGEGDVIIDVMNEMGYTAAAVGNHEFDFGPVGPDAVPTKETQDPRGALKARAAQANFPILGANILDSKSKKQVGWPNMGGTLLTEVAGISVGIIGLTTIETPTTTIAANVVGLDVVNLADTVVAEAKGLRAKGAKLILIAAHAGGRCSEFLNPSDLSSCDDQAEIFDVARSIPPGTVDVIVAGHSHAGLAHVVNGIAVVEGFAHSVAFDRVDLAVNPRTGEVVDRRIHAPQNICKPDESGSYQPATCETVEYEGVVVEPNKEVAAIVAKAVARAKELRDSRLGANVEVALLRSYGSESALGNWLADLMLAAHPAADVALTNGGGLRADLPAGPLTYGRLHSVTPFDNRFALVNVSGAELGKMIATNLGHEKGIFSVAGLRAKAQCLSGQLVVELARSNGKTIGAGEMLTVVTSDFLATGGDQAFAELARKPGRVRMLEEATIRDAVAEVLRKRGGAVSGADHRIFDPEKPRLAYSGERPVACN